ncbi:hypothetical protein N1851_022096 [Merluccius polli]|uniref:Uncharacterized protein n=1 Tax=Merluccius polli TaxID=89951 RepID=A0AA47MIU0_MERPO|nr:hypothetical protein N1851_022096 [Merluccius polli]
MNKECKKKAEVQRKLSQLQLEEMTKKEKDKKKQAAVAEPGTMMPTVKQAQPQPFTPLTQQPQSQSSPASPVVNVYTQNSGNPYNGNRQSQYRGPQGQGLDMLSSRAGSGPWATAQVAHMVDPAMLSSRDPLASAKGLWSIGDAIRKVTSEEIVLLTPTHQCSRDREDRDSRYREERDSKDRETAITNQADEEPVVQVLINKRHTNGATYTCVSSKYASHLPMAGTFAKTIGFVGQTQLIPMTAPVTLKLLRYPSWYQTPHQSI